MISLPPLTLTLGALAGPVTLVGPSGIDQSSDLSIQLSSAAADGDVVILYVSQINNLETMPLAQAIAHARYLTQIGGQQQQRFYTVGINPLPSPLTPAGGQLPVQTANPQFPYLYALLSVQASAPAVLTLLVSGQETAGTAGGGGGGGVTSVTGTGGVVASPTTGAVILSTPTLGTPTTLDKGVPALATPVPPADQVAAVATGLSAAPKGYVRVILNGVSYDAVGTKTGGVCYFADPTNTTVYAQGSIPAGAILYWNQSQSFTLATTDVFDFDYDA